MQPMRCRTTRLGRSPPAAPSIGNTLTRSRRAEVASSRSRARADAAHRRHQARTCRRWPRRRPARARSARRRTRPRRGRGPAAASTSATSAAWRTRAGAPGAAGPGGRQQQVGPPAQGLDQQGGPAGVEGGVGVRDVARAAAARAVAVDGCPPARGRPGRRRGARRIAPSAPGRGRASRPGDRHAAEHAAAALSGCPSTALARSLAKHRSNPATSWSAPWRRSGVKSSCRNDSGDDGRRGGAEAAPLRDGVAADQPQPAPAGGRRAPPRPGSSERCDQVPLVARHIRGRPRPRARPRAPAARSPTRDVDVARCRGPARCESKPGPRLALLAGDPHLRTPAADRGPGPRHGQPRARGPRPR